MGKKTSQQGQGSGPSRPAKEVLYVEMEASLKRRLVRLAGLPHRNRKITAEAIMAIRRYVEEEEARENLPPLEDEPSEPPAEGAGQEGQAEQPKKTTRRKKT
jgi:hypothetical protein